MTKTPSIHLNSRRGTPGKKLAFGIPDYASRGSDREAGMKCPNCGEARCRTIDSRPTDAGAATRRRRVCLSCEFRFTTLEVYRPEVALDYSI